MEPLFGQVTRELESTIMKIHREDFTNRGRPPSRGGSESTSSQYVVELAGKIRWLHRELFSKLQCGEDSREWYGNWMLLLCESEVQSIYICVQGTFFRTANSGFLPSTC